MDAECMDDLLCCRSCASDIRISRKSCCITECIWFQDYDVSSRCLRPCVCPAHSDDSGSRNEPKDFYPKHQDYLCSQQMSSATLPELLNFSKDMDGRRVVISRVGLPVRTLFGPFVAPMYPSTKESGDSFALTANPDLASEGKLVFLLDSDDDCNWMKHVRRVHDPVFANLIAFQYCGAVYFMSVRAVGIGEELVVALSEDYSKQLAESDVAVLDEYPEDSLAECKGNDSKLMLEEEPIEECQANSADFDELILGQIADWIPRNDCFSDCAEIPQPSQMQQKLQHDLLSCDDDEPMTGTAASDAEGEDPIESVPASGILRKEQKALAEPSSSDILKHFNLTNVSESPRSVVKRTFLDLETSFESPDFLPPLPRPSAASASGNNQEKQITPPKKTSEVPEPPKIVQKSVANACRFPSLMSAILTHRGKEITPPKQTSQVPESPKTLQKPAASSSRFNSLMSVRPVRIAPKPPVSKDRPPETVIIRFPKTTESQLLVVGSSTVEVQRSNTSSNAAGSESSIRLCLKSVTTPQLGIQPEPTAESREEPDGSSEPQIEPDHKIHKCQVCHISMTGRKAWFAHAEHCKPPEKSRKRKRINNGKAYKQYECLYCKTKCLWMRLLAHAVTHKIDGKFPCPVGCGQQFDKYEEMKNHNTAEHSPLRCDQCDYTTRSAKNLSRHRQTHRNKKVTCEQCGEVFTTKKGLEGHVERIHGERDRTGHKYFLKPRYNRFARKDDYTIWFFKCEECKMGFPWRKKFLAHLDSKHPEKPKASIPELGLPMKNCVLYYCRVCGTTHASEKRMLDHAKARHTVEEIAKAKNKKGAKKDKGSGNAGNTNNENDGDPFADAIEGKEKETYYCDFCEYPYLSPREFLQHCKHQHSDYHDILMPHMPKDVVYIERRNQGKWLEKKRTLVNGGESSAEGED